MEDLVTGAGRSILDVGVVGAVCILVIVSLIVRMFPGRGPHSFCQDFGAAGSLHAVFDPVLEELDRVLMRARSLMLVDWRTNRDIRSQIEKVRGPRARSV